MSAAAFSLRRAGLADVAQLCDLERRSFATDRLSRRSFRRLVRSKAAYVLVALHRDRLASCLIVLFRKGAQSCRLYSLAVDRALRGKGLAAKMLRTAERHARWRGAGRIALEVRADNARARAFYRKFGFLPFATLPRYYGDGTAAIRYEKPLGGGRR
jgi:ribosomal protein S18 acetylase RimI-like enzyme